MTLLDDTAPAGVSLALSRWIGPACPAPAGAKAWTTPAGATLALVGDFALKLQSRSLRRRVRIARSELECDASMRLPEERRVAITVLWMELSSSHLQSDSDNRHREPALLMHRLDSTGIRERLSGSKSRIRQTASEFARVLSAFHRQSRSVRTRADLAKKESADLKVLRQMLDRNGTTLKLSPSSSRLVEFVVRRAGGWLHTSRPALAERSRVGLRKDGHGDLHCDNLHFLHGKATLIDLQPHRMYRVNDVACDLGRLVLELHRLGGYEARQSALEAYEDSAAPVPKPLVSYFEAKALLVDLAVISKYRALGRPEPERGTELLKNLSTICSGLLALP